MSILIKNVELNNKTTDIYIEKNLIKTIGNNLDIKADEIIDGTNKAVIPSFTNTHTHSAMTLLRGFADDMLLNDWLENEIWPIEDKLTDDDLYWGGKLACLEMIKSGTTLYNDMYGPSKGIVKALSESGIRGTTSKVFIDFFDKEKRLEQINDTLKQFEESKNYDSKVIFTLAAHAIYTVSEESLIWIKNFAKENNLLIHFHLSETEKEVDDCLENHGMRPVEYLEKIGFLGPNLIAAHVVHVNKNEIQLLKKYDVKIAHSPTSNMKLSSGIMPYQAMKDAGLTITLSTDGASSNNNLDMLEEMKIATLLQKVNNKPTTLPATEVFEMATVNGAKALNIKIGKIEEEYLADLLLIDMNNIALIPHHNLISNLVYSATSEVIDTTICDGVILMKNRIVKGEEEIIKMANKVAQRLVAEHRKED